MPYFDLITEADPQRLLNQLLDHTLFLERDAWAKQAGATIKRAEGLGQFDATMKRVAKETRPSERRFLMHDLEQAYFDGLPDTITIYQLANSKEEVKRFKWLLDEQLAKEQAAGLFGDGSPANLYAATVDKKIGFVKSRETGYVGFDFYLATSPDALHVTQLPIDRPTPSHALSPCPTPPQLAEMHRAQRQFEDETLITESRERDFAINFDEMHHTNAPTPQYSVFVASAKTLAEKGATHGAMYLPVGEFASKADFLAHCQQLPLFSAEPSPLFMCWPDGANALDLPSYLFTGTTIRDDAWEWLELPILQQQAVSAYVMCFDFFRDVATTLHLAHRYCVATPQSFAYMLEGYQDAGRLAEFEVAFTGATGGFIFRKP